MTFTPLCLSSEPDGYRKSSPQYSPGLPFLCGVQADRWGQCAIFWWCDLRRILVLGPTRIGRRSRGRLSGLAGRVDRRH